ncbi:MAG: class D sortase [Gemmatimonadota bacterium]|nr:class D sortase [Gemmatimonadota bacterium]
MRRRIGAALYVSGAVLLLAAGSAYARGAFARDRARALWAEVDAHRAVTAARASIDGGSLAIATRGAPVGRLVIPRIALDEVVVEGVGDDELSAGPGHLPGSVLPGETGNAVVSAHRDRHFHGIDALAAGDTIITETSHDRVTWLVSSRRVVGRGEPALFSTAGATLTLTTCWPVRYVGPAPDRLIITASPVARAPRA